MYHRHVLSVTLFALIFIVLPQCTRSSDYTVPEPNIEIFSKGFRFSIPHDDGVELFAFHGNINQPMDGLEAGHFSKDILKKCGDKWVFEEKNRKLRTGDSISFWLYVLKDGLGYRYDDGSFTVKDTNVDMSPLECGPMQPSKSSCSQCQDWLFDPQRSDQHDPKLDVRTNFNTLRKSKRNVQSSVCCDLYLNATASLVDLAQHNMKLQTENQILFEIAQKDEYFSKSMKIFGKYPVKYYPTPVDFVRSFVKEKLLLDDVAVIEAKAIPDHGVSFKVDSLNGKVKIIMAAKRRLEGSQYELIW